MATGFAGFLQASPPFTGVGVRVSCKAAVPVKAMLQHTASMVALGCCWHFVRKVVHPCGGAAGKKSFIVVLQTLTHVIKWSS